MLVSSGDEMQVEFVSVIKDILLSIAAIVTASVAIIGLRSWKKELSGKASFEVARGLIRATYKLRDEINYGRSPFTHANEFPDDYDPRNKTEEKEAKAWAYIFTNRWKPIAEAILEFDANVLEAEALWGGEIKDKTSELKRCAHNLRASMESYVRNEASGGRNFESNNSLSERIHSEIWSGWGDEGETDKLSERINDSIYNIESELRPYLTRI